MHKAIPPRMVEPYLTGRRSIISGFVHRVTEPRTLPSPREFHSALNLDYEGSEFAADMPEIYACCAGARVGTDAYQIAIFPDRRGDWSMKPPFTAMAITASDCLREWPSTTSTRCRCRGAEIHRVGDRRHSTSSRATTARCGSARQKGLNSALPADGDVPGSPLRPASGRPMATSCCPSVSAAGGTRASSRHRDWRRSCRSPKSRPSGSRAPVGTFRGERCMVLDDLGDRLHIGYLGHNGYQAEQLGYWQVDRGVYELVAARSEVSEIIEERTDYPRHGPPRPDPRRTPARDYPPPGSPQQAQYLPPEPRDQASYLLGRPRFLPDAGRAGYQRDTAPGYQPAGPASGQFSWSDPGLPAQHPSGPILDRSGPTAQHPSGPILDRSGPTAQHPSGPILDRSGPTAQHPSGPILDRSGPTRPAPVRPHPRPVRANRPAPVRPHPRPVRANRPAPVRPHPRPVRAADAAGPGLPGEPGARQRRRRARTDGAPTAAGSRRAPGCYGLPAAAGHPAARQ